MADAEGEGLEGSENAGCDGERAAEASEDADWDRDEIGAVKFWRFGSDVWGDSGEMGLVDSS